MARNPVCVSVKFYVKTESISAKFPSLIVAVFERVVVEYTWRISSLSATQFMVEKSIYADTSYGIDLGSFLWGRTSSR